MKMLKDNKGFVPSAMIDLNDYKKIQKLELPPNYVLKGDIQIEDLCALRIVIEDDVTLHSELVRFLKTHDRSQIWELLQKAG